MFCTCLICTDQWWLSNQIENTSKSETQRLRKFGIFPDQHLLGIFYQHRPIGLMLNRITPFSWLNLNIDKATTHQKWTAEVSCCISTLSTGTVRCRKKIKVHLFLKQENYGLSWKFILSFITQEPVSFVSLCFITCVTHEGAVETCIGTLAAQGWGLAHLYENNPDWHRMKQMMAIFSIILNKKELWT